MTTGIYGHPLDVDVRVAVTTMNTYVRATPGAPAIAAFDPALAALE